MIINNFFIIKFLINFLIGSSIFVFGAFKFIGLKKESLYDPKEVTRVLRAKEQIRENTAKPKTKTP